MHIYEVLVGADPIGQYDPSNSKR